MHKINTRYFYFIFRTITTLLLFWWINRRRKKRAKYFAIRIKLHRYIWLVYLWQTKRNTASLQWLFVCKYYASGTWKRPSPPIYQTNYDWPAPNSIIHAWWGQPRNIPATSETLIYSMLTGRMSIQKIGDDNTHTEIRWLWHCYQRSALVNIVGSCFWLLLFSKYLLKFECFWSWRLICIPKISQWICMFEIMINISRKDIKLEEDYDKL